MLISALKYYVTLSMPLFLSIAAFESAEQYAGELEKYVDSGYVDYKNWTKDHDGLDKFIESLEAIILDSLTEDESKALLINAYNAGMIRLIIQNYPIEGVFDIKPKVFEQKAINIGGATYSLDDIEHGLLRKMGDPRIHFAIVCGSVGCPDLSPEIYRPDSLDRQLDRAAKNYLSRSKGMVIEKDPPLVLLSSIFKWFGDDFGDTRPALLITLSQYLEDEDADYIRENADAIRVRYIDYDWSLNGD